MANRKAKAERRKGESACSELNLVLHDDDGSSERRDGDVTILNDHKV